MPSGLNIRSCMTSPKRLPRTASTTLPTQSMLLPYSHAVPGSCISTDRMEAMLALTTLGTIFAAPYLNKSWLKKS